MSVQRINLLHEGLLPKRVPLVFRDLLKGAAALVLILAVVSLAQVHTLWEVRGQSEALAERAEALKRASTKLKEQEVVQLDRALESEVEALNAAHQAQLKMAALLESEQRSVVQRGFSGHFKELSEHILDGVWLTRIELVAGGAPSATLQGKTGSAPLVPAFIRALSDGERFDGYRFATISLEAEEQWLDFRVAGPVAD